MRYPYGHHQAKHSSGKMWEKINDTTKLKSKRTVRKIKDKRTGILLE
jgi:hypothetical protein